MGCRILSGEDGAVLYCSTTMVAFGPVFESEDHAEDFIKWLGDDPRHYTQAELADKYTLWLSDGVACENCGEGPVRGDSEKCPSCGMTFTADGPEEDDDAGV